MRRERLSVFTVISVVLSVLAALTISVAPLGVGAATFPWPRLTVAVVFFWLLHRPRAMPVWAVFLVGLAQDLTGGGIVGAGTLPLVIASAAFRPFAEQVALSPLPMRAFAFLGFAALTMTGEWMLTGLARWAIPPLSAPLAQFFVTVLFYLPLSIVFRRVLRIGRT